MASAVRTMALFHLVCVLALPLCLALPRPGSYFTDEAAARLLHYDDHSGDCVLFGDRRIVDEIMRELAASESPVAVVEARELTALISACYRRRDKRPDHTPPHADNFPHIIYPGTKWCGTGNVAEGLSDLGPLVDLDACCRDHDLCPDDLEPGQARHNITNDSPFTMSHCDCNDSFRSCLETVGSPEAKEVGAAYFSTGLFQCYRLDKPVTQCKEWAGVTGLNNIMKLWISKCMLLPSNYCMIIQEKLLSNLADPKALSKTLSSRVRRLYSRLLTQACQTYEYNDKGIPRWQIFDMKAF